ncbi:unnamed protein product [Onchocerca flexuosa]|uniref:YTH domain-containing protein n=1 Tax=Onchocerca flexuosa TaxID=387005 RepID=A0A183HZC1_9BILA|nr:unnamed protein product [Onchocerca flexuosa]
MGRRKLPSIPTQRAEKVSETPSAPVYLTSSAPLVFPSPDRQYHAQDPRAYSQPTSRTASLSNLSLSSSTSTAYCHTVDPAILPGAAIVNAKPKLHLRQTTSAATGDRSLVLGHPSGTKMPSPLARLSLRHRNSASNLFSASEPNLLESTAKYFAEYDRQLREHGRRLKNRFAFSDDDPVNRETRKQRVMDELAQRKEKISSMIDLYSPSAFPTIHPTSDYSSTVPHYGSLPRIDFPTTRSPRSNRCDYINRNRNRPSFGYGSLPRNYERYTDRSYSDAQNDYFQSFPFPAGRYNALSRSWNNVNLTTAENSILDSRTRLYATRHMNYLDPWLSYQRLPESNVIFGRPLMKAAYDNSYRPQYISGTRAQNFDGPQSLPNTDIISQYANYLSNQFITNQQKLMNGYPAEERMYLNQAKKRPCSVPRYRFSTTSGQAPPMVNCEDPLSSVDVDSTWLHPNQPIQHSIIPDSYVNFPSYMQNEHYENWPWYQQFSYASSNAIDNNAVLPYHYSNHFPQTSNTLPGTSPLLGQVYSRNDANYGSRPTHYATEYGNYYRDRASSYQLQDFSNRNNAVRSHYPYIPCSNQYYAGNRYLGAGEQPYSPSQSSAFLNNFAPTSQQPGHVSRAWSNGNITMNSYDAVYPKEDALNRLYTTLSNQRSMRPQHYGNGVTSFMYS